MSTKGLMAHKKVALVTLNAAGKADTLTLVDPWKFEGGSGPFKLTNVEHGHQIVKAATGGEHLSPARAPSAPRTAKPAALPIDPGPRPDMTQPMTRDLASATPSIPAREDAEQMFVYHWLLRSELENHEISGWLKTGRRWTPKMLADHALELGRPYLRAGATDYEPVFTLWTRAMEKKARDEHTMGSPWASTNANHGALS